MDRREDTIPDYNPDLVSVAFGVKKHNESKNHKQCAHLQQAHHEVGREDYGSYGRNSHMLADGCSGGKNQDCDAAAAQHDLKCLAQVEILKNVAKRLENQKEGKQCIDCFSRPIDVKIGEVVISYRQSYGAAQDRKRHVKEEKRIRPVLALPHQDCQQQSAQT